MSAWRIGVAVAIASIAGVATPVAAQPAAPAIAWRADLGCGSQAALEARIAEHLGRPLAASDRLAAEVEVVRAPIERDVRARIAIRTHRGVAVREVHGADCTAVVEAVAFVLASAVDAGADPAGPGHPALDDDDPDDGREPATPPSAPPSRYGPQPRLRIHFRLDGWSDAGTMPELRLGAGGSLGVSYARIRAEVGAATWREDWVAGGGHGTVALREIDVRGCGAAWRVWLCGGGLVGRFASVGQATRPWSALSLLVRWSRPFGGHLAVSASIEGVAALDRLREADGTATLGTAPLAVRIGLGVEAIAF